MATKCWSCGTTYDGWSCPMCSVKKETDKKLDQQMKDTALHLEQSRREHEKMLEEQSKAMVSTLENAQIDMDYSLEVAAQRQQQIANEEVERHKVITSEAWKLQADSKAERAYELYKAGLYQEAINLCLEAISQDPGNIKPYIFAEWSFIQLGQGEKAKDYFKKQINLLKAKQYRSSQEAALLVLRGDINNEDRVQSFLDASKEFAYFSFALIDELMQHSLYESAYKLYLNTINKLFLNQTDNGNILLSHVYGIDLSNKVSSSPDMERLINWLRGVPYTKKSDIFQKFENMVKNSNKFSENTINVVREKILHRYEEWKPEISQEIRNQAQNQANERTQKISSRMGSLVGWTVFFVCWIFSAYIWELTERSINAAVLFLISLSIAILIGKMVGKSYRNRKKGKALEKIKKELITSAEAEEQKTVAAFLS